MNKLPVYKLSINEDDENSGVIAIALVDNPAIEINWQAFNDVAKHCFKATDLEKHVISGPLMVADKLIYRNDSTYGEYNVVFDAQTIEKIVQKFFKKQHTSNINMMHSDKLNVDGVYMFESWIIDNENGKTAPKGFEKLSNGSWFGSFKVDNQQIWDDFIKTGVYSAFSVEGYFIENPKTQDEQLIDELNRQLSKVSHK